MNRRQRGRLFEIADEILTETMRARNLLLSNRHETDNAALWEIYTTAQSVVDELENKGNFGDATEELLEGEENDHYEPPIGC